MSTNQPSRKARREPLARKQATHAIRAISAKDWLDDYDVTAVDVGLCLASLDALGPVLIDRRGVALLLNEDGE